MKKKFSVSYFLCVIAMMMLLAGCGASSTESASEPMAMAAPAEEMIMYDTGYGMENYVTAEEAVEEEGISESEPVEVSETQRKLIKTVNLEVETENFDELMKTVNEKIEGLGGYVESSYVYNGSKYRENNRHADLTLRIPAENLSAFLSAMDENSNVTSKNENVEDVTLQYVDMKSHKEALETEQDRLLELLAQAETVEDIITIEGRLSEVRYQIESMESQLRTLDNQVSYSTVYVYIEEVKRYTPVKEQTIGEKISTGFVESLYDVGEGIVDFCVDFIINIPYLVIWAVVIILLLVVFKAIRKRHAKKKMKNMLKQTDLEKAEVSADGKEKEDK